jgi:hypothetical protein
MFPSTALHLPFAFLTSFTPLLGSHTVHCATSKSTGRADTCPETRSWACHQTEQILICPCFSQIRAHEENAYFGMVVSQDYRRLVPCSP